MTKYFIPLALLGLTLGCDGDAPTTPENLSPAFAIAGSSGCYTVSGALDQGVDFADPDPVFSGTISGDIEGTVVSVITGPPFSRGVVGSNPVEQTWEVTGGIVEPLIGEQLLLENEVLGVFAEPEPLVARIRTIARIVEGARRGNLTFHGTTDFTGFPVVTSHLEYRGVICP
jgi:hypothetical protein